MKLSTKPAALTTLPAVPALLTLCALHFFAAPALAKDVTLDLNDIAQTDAKTAPPAPKAPAQRTIEINSDDILIVQCPAKQYPGAKGWIEYHARLQGPGVLISTMRQQAHAEAFQATGPGTQQILVGLKQPGSTEIEKDCLVTVKVVRASAQADIKSNSPNVQSYAGTKVFGNKTAATTGTTGVNSTVHTINGFPQSGSQTGIQSNFNTGNNQSGNGAQNQSKPATHTIEEQSRSTVKTY